MVTSQKKSDERPRVTWSEEILTEFNEEEREELREQIEQGLADVDAGRVHSWEDVLSEVRAQEAEVLKRRKNLVQPT